MKFVRMYGAGLNPKRANPLDKVWAEFHCSVCDSKSDIDVTNRTGTFQFHVDRKCPKCGCFNPEDKVTNIRSMINKLVNDKKQIENEINKLISELELIES